MSKNPTLLPKIPVFMRFRGPIQDEPVIGPPQGHTILQLPQFANPMLKGITPKRPWGAQGESPICVVKTESQG